MAGHNKWSKIKHRKAVVDKRRGKVWTKVSKAIIVAAKHGGADPAANIALRYAIDEARYANMPRDTIERAIRKGAGGEDTSTYETVRYEGYAPGGVAIVVDALTDNRTRTAADVRLAFSDAGCTLGTSGCVSYMFQLKGQIFVDPKGVQEDAILSAALDAGAQDVEAPQAGEDEAPWLVSTDVPGYLRVREALEKAGYTVVQAGLEMVPDTRTAVAGEHAEKLAELVDALEELDDVQKVYTNAAD